MVPGERVFGENSDNLAAISLRLFFVVELAFMELR